MKRLLVAAAWSAACGSPVSPSEPQVVAFERWSPAQASATDLLLAARGDVVVMARRISHDGGATWSPLPPQLGELSVVALTRVAERSHMTVYGTAAGLARVDLATLAVTPVTGLPPYASERTWRVDPSGNLMVYDSVENAIALERGGAWTTSTLPQLAATDVRPYIKDIESNGQTLLVVSAWGVHRSTDGEDWERVADGGDARDIVVLHDRRFILVGDGPARAFDAAGAAAGTLAQLDIEEHEAAVCEDGALVVHDRVTYDLGASWQTLIGGGDLAMTVQRAHCGGGRYWAIALSDVWGYRFVRFDALGAPGIAAGNWDAGADQAWDAGGPQIVRTGDGSFLAAGFALAPGAAEWTLREIPSRTWASGDALFGVQRGSFFTSFDGGTTWSETRAIGLEVTEPEAFARTADGTLYVSEMTGGGNPDGSATWRAAVWQSVDRGATWSLAYEGIATRASEIDEVEGEAHRFVGITAEGTWIATDAVSTDGGVTWLPTEVDGDRGLAHLTHAGSLVTGDANEDLWRVYDDGGRGELRATYRIEVEGTAIPASQLRSVAFDEDGYAYVARGTPHVQIWRSNRPLDPVVESGR